MRSSFFDYYRPTIEEFAALWSRGTFVIDANVLLNLYRYPKDASSDLLAALSKLQERLWMPYQAALEYQENRLIVIGEQISKYDGVRKVLNDVPNSLKAGLDKLQIKKRHSSINADQLLETISKTLSEFKAQLDELEREQLGVTGPDTLRDEIDRLFAGRIGAPPANQEELEEIYKTGTERYANEIPPGYLDDKEGSHRHHDLSFSRKFGDLVIWEELIKCARSRDQKDVVLVTDDDKSDWWSVVESRGKKTIGPRRELIEEIRKRAGVDVFYMYSSEGFLTYAKEYLGTELKAASIHQVRDVSRRARNPRQMKIMGRHAVDTVIRWLKTLFGDEQVVSQPGYPDIIVNRQGGKVLGFEVQYIWDRAEMRRRTSPKFFELLMSRAQTHHIPITLVFIAPDHRLASELEQTLEITQSPLVYTIGTVTDLDGAATFSAIYGTNPVDLL